MWFSMILSIRFRGAQKHFCLLLILKTGEGFSVFEVTTVKMARIASAHLASYHVIVGCLTSILVKTNL